MFVKFPNFVDEIRKYLSITDQVHLMCVNKEMNRYFSSCLKKFMDDMYHEYYMMTAICRFIQKFYDTDMINLIYLLVNNDYELCPTAADDTAGYGYRKLTRFLSSKNYKVGYYAIVAALYYDHPQEIEYIESTYNIISHLHPKSYHGLCRKGRLKSLKYLHSKNINTNELAYNRYIVPLIELDVVKYMETIGIRVNQRGMDRFVKINKKDIIEYLSTDHTITNEAGENILIKGLEIRDDASNVSIWYR